MEHSRARVTSLDPTENEQATDQHDQGHPELDVEENCFNPAIRAHDPRLRINGSGRQAEKNYKLRTGKELQTQNYLFWVIVT
jgi:hypothetical protein